MGSDTMSNKRKNKVIGFKAFHDTDSDILGWWNGMSDGERSNALRKLIRHHLGTQGSVSTEPDRSTDELRSVRADTAWIREALNEMPGYFERLFTNIAVVRPTGEVPQMGDRLSEEAIQRRQANLKKRTW
jgi:hypothetical protein